METLTDVALNPAPFLQKGDLVAASLFFESIAMTVIAAFLLLQLNQVPRRWRMHNLIGGLITVAAALAAFYRRDFWVQTLTNPVEFKFFDWFITVPLMGVLFFLMARPYGAKAGMLIRLLASILFMLICGYLGEAMFPEQAVLTGALATLGLVAIISVIMFEGYTKVAKLSVDPVVKKGYGILGLSLPIAWLAYPIGYLSVPGNLLEGFLSTQEVLILYSLANILSKGGLVMGVYAISILSREGQGLTEDGPMREQNHELSEVENLRKQVQPSSKPTQKAAQPAFVKTIQTPSVDSPWG